MVPAALRVDLGCESRTGGFQPPDKAAFFYEVLAVLKGFLRYFDFRRKRFVKAVKDSQEYAQPQVNAEENFKGAV